MHAFTFMVFLALSAIAVHPTRAAEQPSPPCPRESTTPIKSLKAAVLSAIAETAQGAEEQGKNGAVCGKYDLPRYRLVDVNRSNAQRMGGNRFTVNVDAPDDWIDLSTIRVVVRTQEGERLAHAGMTLSKSGRLVAYVPLEVEQRNDAGDQAVEFSLSPHLFRDFRVGTSVKVTNTENPELVTYYDIDIASFAPRPPMPPQTTVPAKKKE